MHLFLVRIYFANYKKYNAISDVLNLLHLFRSIFPIVSKEQKKNHKILYESDKTNTCIVVVFHTILKKSIFIRIQSFSSNKIL